MSPAVSGLGLGSCPRKPPATNYSSELSTQPVSSPGSQGQLSHDTKGLEQSSEIEAVP